jgi:heptosyltransferase-2
MGASNNQFSVRAARGLGHALSRCFDYPPRRTVAGRVLLVKTHALGDILMTTPAVRRLRRLLPGAELIYLTGESARPLLEGNPHLHRVVTVPEHQLLDRRPGAVLRTVRLIAGLGCETAVLFHPAWPVHLLTRLARVPRRFGFDDNGSGFSLTGPVTWRAPNDVHYVVEDYLRLASAAAGAEIEAPGPGDLEMELDPGDAGRAGADELIAARGADPGAGPIGMAPAGGVNPRDRVAQKRWPTERFAKLADRLAGETGRPIWLFGSAGEAELVREVAGRMDHPAVDFSGATTLSTLAGLIGRLRLLVTVDSAPMHMARAMGVPVAALFGPSRASALIEEAPAGVGVVQADLDCCPCYNNEPFPGCRQAVSCMERIGVDAVYSLCRTILSCTEDSE